MRVPCPPATAEPYLPCQLDRDAIGDVAATYPNQLRAAKIGGSVRVSFIIDTLGRARSIEIKQAGHPLFQNAIRSALPNVHFDPARLDGRRVSARHEELFVFVPPTTDVLPVSYWRDTLPDGTRRTTLREIPRDSTLPVFSETEALEIQRAMLADFLRSVPTDPASAYKPTICVTMMIDRDQSVAADDETLRILGSMNRPVVTPQDCPRTYSSMFGIVADSAPPAGWIDPYHLRVESLVRWTRDIALLTFMDTQGTLTRDHQCALTRGLAGWAIKCETTSTRIS